MSEDIQKTGEGSDEYYERGTLPHATKNIPPSDDICIKMEGVNKWYGDFHVLKDINLKVCAGERIVICGPSGSGKSTLIRCLNRLEEHQDGTISVDGIELDDNLKHIEEVRREVGMVFQHFNLFPHLTVLENLTLAPIWVRKTPKKEAEENSHAVSEQGKNPRAGGQISGAIIRRSAAAGCHCAFIMHETQNHAL